MLWTKTRKKRPKQTSKWKKLAREQGLTEGAVMMGQEARVRAKLRKRAKKKK